MFEFCPERFNVNNAKTKRFRNSAIVYMQNLLNKNDKNEKKLKQAGAELCQAQCITVKSLYALYRW